MGSVHVGKPRRWEKRQKSQVNTSSCAASNSPESYTAMPPPQPVTRSPGSLSFRKKTLLLISFHSEKIPSDSCLEYVLWFYGQASQRLVAQRSLMASGQLAPSAVRHDLWNPWETSRASSTDGYEPPPHPLHSLWLSNQYFHRQLEIPAGPSEVVHSSSLCL